MLFVFAIGVAVYAVASDTVIRYRTAFVVLAVCGVLYSAISGSPHFWFYGALNVAIGLERQLSTRNAALSNPFVRWHVPLFITLLLWGAAWLFDPTNYELWSKWLLLGLLGVSGLMGLRSTEGPASPSTEQER
ncbi:MAG: hypothetical protein HC933_15025 [Pleurocapsa sp. SU_196_0]|nr:hypothetical protein [Pleurocapsa sp. SU_196_0]